MTPSNASLSWHDDVQRWYLIFTLSAEPNSPKHAVHIVVEPLSLRVADGGGPTAFRAVDRLLDQQVRANMSLDIYDRGQGHLVELRFTGAYGDFSALGTVTHGFTELLGVLTPALRLGVQVTSRDEDTAQAWKRLVTFREVPGLEVQSWNVREYCTDIVLTAGALTVSGEVKVGTDSVGTTVKQWPPHHAAGGALAHGFEFRATDITFQLRRGKMEAHAIVGPRFGWKLPAIFSDVLRVEQLLQYCMDNVTSTGVLKLN